MPADRPKDHTRRARLRDAAARRGRPLARWSAAAVLALSSLAGCTRDPAGPALEACRLKGLEIPVVCSTIEVAEDRDASPPSPPSTPPSPPSRSNAPGRRIPIRFAVIPALAPHPERDAIFVLAGGPGQAATDVAGQVYPLFAKLNQERDIVLVDQRGTGASHPLSCKPEFEGTGFADTFDPSRYERLAAACAKRLAADADLTRYGTDLAVRDLDDVRARLGYPTVNLWGASYGTRVALEYLRQFPDRVRTMTLDGVAPPSLKLPLSFGVDTHAAVVRLVADCRADPRCTAAFPALADDVAALFARLGADGVAIDVDHPVTGRREHVRLTATTLSSLLRTPLYVSLTASVAPLAISRAADGDYDALAALALTVGNGLEQNVALGMHLSVLCSEDLLAIDDADLAAARAESARSVVDGRPNPFALVYLDQYRRLCAAWPTRRPPAAFYASPAGRPGANVPTLLLSGGIDPATPPRHADDVATGLVRARRIVAPHVGHGLSLQGCGPDLVERFVRAADASTLDPHCLEAIPRPLFVVPVARPSVRSDATAVPRAATGAGR